jgi:hypothetical protein
MITEKFIFGLLLGSIFGLVAFLFILIRANKKKLPPYWPLQKGSATDGSDKHE